MENWVVETERRLSTLEVKVEVLEKTSEEIQTLAEETHTIIATNQTIKKERLKWLRVVGKYWHTIVLILIPLGSVIAHFLLNLFSHL